MASGDTLVVLTALNNEPPASNPATFDTRNQHPVLDFDADTSEDGVFSAAMPRNYGGGGVTVYCHYSMSSATGNSVKIDAAFERVGDEQQDIDSDGFAAANTVTDAVPTTTGHVGIANITFTDGADMDSVAVGEKFRIKITRDASDVADDALGDMELHLIEIKET